MKHQNTNREALKSVGIDIDMPHLMIGYEQLEQAIDAIKEKMTASELDPATIDLDFIRFLLKTRLALGHDVTSVDELIDFSQSGVRDTVREISLDEAQTFKASDPGFLMGLSFNHRALLGDDAKLRYYYLKPSDKLVKLLESHTIAGNRYLTLDETDHGYMLSMKYSQIVGGRKLLDLPKSAFTPLLDFIKANTIYIEPKVVMQTANYQ